MTKRLSATLLTALLALTACGAPSANTPVATPKPVKPIQSAGVFTLNMNGVGRNAQAMTSSVTRAGLSAQAGEVNGLTFKSKSASSVADMQNGVLHLVATFTVTNNTTTAINVPTFVPVDTSGAYATDGETPFLNVVTRTGQPISPAGIRLERAHYQTTDPTTQASVITENPTSTPFLSNLDTGALGLTLPASTEAPGISHQGWQTAPLAAGGTVDVDFAVSIKLKGSDVGDDDPFRFSLVFAVADNPGTVALDNIATLQGSTPSGDAASPVAGSTRTVEGIVTSVNTGTNLNGFWIQEEGIDRDADAASSDGIFVYCGTASGNCPAVTLGQRVRVTGVVSEYVKATQLAPTSAGGVVSVATNVPLPEAQTLTLPLPVAQRERHEGMRVTVSGKVTNNFPLGRYASFDIADDRILNFTQLNTPDTTANAAYQVAAKDRYIRIDDGSRAQNPDPEIFARGGQPLSAANTLRGGDQVTATGILTFGNDGTSTTGSTSGGAADAYRIQSTQANVQITDANPRLSTPESVGGTTRVGSMNVLNYFTTLVTTNEGCTPNGTDSANSRGANDCFEFIRQQTKIVKAITGLNPDVLGILEMQNDFDKGSNSSIANLVNALNVEAGAGTYAYINPGKKIGTDVISVAMIYKPASVDPVGTLAILDNSVNATYGDTCNRPTWAQTFQSKANGGRFTAVMMHLKSKGSACSAFNDADTGDGQGNGYIARRNAASAIVSWLGTNPTGVTEDDRVLMGDYNAYASEEPLTILASGGYANVFDKNVYSYQFDGQWGSLDQATATSSMIGQVAGHTKWHINSDEPTVLDYNKEFKTTGQVSSFYSADPFRSSDHDPILLGLNLTAQTPITPPAQTTSISLSAQNSTVTAGQSGTATVTVNRTNYTGAVALAVDNVTGTGTAPSVTVTTQPDTGTSGTLTVDATNATAGTYTVTVRGTGTGVSDATTTFDVTVSSAPVAGTPWINEFSYDSNAANDTGDEYVEVIVPSGVNVSNLSLVLYNGTGGAVYRTDTFAGNIVTTTALNNGYTTYLFSYPTTTGGAFQNGAPDGMALCSGTQLIQFLSYEGAFAGVGGCANGVTSTDVGVSQLGTTPTGQSLQLSGTGNKYSDFTWNAPAANTKGAVNTNQTLN
ncbi:ExeM/NucH family extracellular endonuclease [Deinococcus radiotolerans]|uniref:Nuclease n=1 Tax=Deinococcus radiotolerans TaxID=1309407 RepID=A0ABQ2FKV3_9DEIO|nr:ExeM/NucH family extracellular endonuclease [Deinococcus radiotolerans]GGL05091.1 nuclease [Deinococcus radiotolerans]